MCRGQPTGVEQAQQERCRATTSVAAKCVICQFRLPAILAADPRQGPCLETLAKCTPHQQVAQETVQPNTTSFPVRSCTGSRYSNGGTRSHHSGLTLPKSTTCCSRRGCAPR